jgi:uracil phosphoribosyltransferase
MKIFSGSYNSEDVEFLVTQIDIEFTDIKTKEQNIRDGMHYSQMLSPEYEPSKEYLELFYTSLENSKLRLANDILTLAKYISNQKDVVLVSLLRAGTPIGVLLKKALKEIFNQDIPHYSISIIRDREIDNNALDFIIKKHKNPNIVFIDGWTGKGVIKAELDKFIALYNQKNNTNISSKLHVLADIAGKADVSATNDDYFIPSSALNSTVSGLVSRSVLDKNYTDKNQFHGVKFYKEYKDSDLSQFFIDTIVKQMHLIEDISDVIGKNISLAKETKEYIRVLQDKFNIKHINHIKPGIAESTRVLLRRDPYLIIVKDIDSPDITHIKQLAMEKNIRIEEDKNLPYSVVGIIKE